MVEICAVLIFFLDIKITESRLKKIHKHGYFNIRGWIYINWFISRSSDWDFFHKFAKLDKKLFCWRRYLILMMFNWPGLVNVSHGKKKFHVFTKNFASWPIFCKIIWNKTFFKKSRSRDIFFKKRSTKIMF